jgi:hypothetical protein
MSKTPLPFLFVVMCASTTHTTTAFSPLTIPIDGKAHVCDISMRSHHLFGRAKPINIVCFQRYPIRKSLRIFGNIKQVLTCSATSKSSSSNTSGVELGLVRDSISSIHEPQGATEEEPSRTEAERSTGDSDSRDPGIPVSIQSPNIPQYNRGESRSLLRKPTARLQKLKDLLTKKEALEALAFAELSLKLDLSGISGNGGQEGMSSGAHLATIDYNRIARRLYDSLRAVRGMVEGASAILQTSEVESLNRRLEDMQTQVGHGAGSGPRILRTTSRHSHLPASANRTHSQCLSSDRACSSRMLAASFDVTAPAPPPGNSPRAGPHHAATVFWA